MTILYLDLPLSKQTKALKNALNTLFSSFNTDLNEILDGYVKRNPYGIEILSEIRSRLHGADPEECRPLLNKFGIDF